METFKEIDEEEIVVEKSFMVDIIEEVLATRRKNTARCRQNLAKSTKEKLNI